MLLASAEVHSLRLPGGPLLARTPPTTGKSRHRLSVGYVNPAVAAAGSRAAAQSIMDAAAEEMGGLSQTQEAQTEAAPAGALLQAPRLARTPPGAVPGEGVIPSSVRMARTPPTAGQPGEAAI